MNQAEIGGRLHAIRPAPAVRSETLPAAAHAETVRYFDGQASGWVGHYTRSPYFRTRLRTVLSWIASQPSGLRILDYGCGSGVFLKRLIDAGHHVTGVDVSSEMLASARQALQSSGVPPERFALEQVGESCKGGYLDSAYDGVMSLGVLEYLDDPVALLEELVQRLRPGGFLILSLPNRRSLVRRLERIVKPAVLRTVERVGAFRRVLPRLAGPDVCFRYQKYQFDLADLERFLASSWLTPAQGLLPWGAGPAEGRRGASGNWRHGHRRVRQDIVRQGPIDVVAARPERLDAPVFPRAALAAICFYLFSPVLCYRSSRLRQDPKKGYRRRAICAPKERFSIYSDGGQR